MLRAIRRATTQDAILHEAAHAASIPTEHIERLVVDDEAQR